MNKLIWTFLIAVGITVLTGTKVLAQGQDSSIPERDIMILGEIFPGVYDNAN